MRSRRAVVVVDDRILVAERGALQAESGRSRTGAITPKTLLQLRPPPDLESPARGFILVGDAGGHGRGRRRPSPVHLARAVRVGVAAGVARPAVVDGAEAAASPRTRLDQSCQGCLRRPERPRTTNCCRTSCRSTMPHSPAQPGPPERRAPSWPVQQTGSAGPASAWPIPLPGR
jgi:hypothetical protein